MQKNIFNKKFGQLRTIMLLHHPQREHIPDFGFKPSNFESGADSTSDLDQNAALIFISQRIYITERGNRRTFIIVIK